MVTCILHLLQLRGVNQHAHKVTHQGCSCQARIGCSDSPHVRVNVSFQFHFTSLKIFPFQESLSSSSSTSCVINIFMPKINLAKGKLYHSFQRMTTNVSFKDDEALDAIIINSPSHTSTLIPSLKCTYHHTSRGRKLYAALLYLTTAVSHIVWTDNPSKPCLQKTLNSQWVGTIATCTFHFLRS